MLTANRKARLKADATNRANPCFDKARKQGGGDIFNYFGNQSLNAMLPTTLFRVTAEGINGLSTFVQYPAYYIQKEATA